MDKLDEKILELLQEKGMIKPRISEIARELGESRSTIHMRVQRLEEKFINNYSPKIDWRRMGYELNGFLGIKCSQKSLPYLKKELENSEKISEFYEMVAGSFDVVVKGYFKGKEGMEKLRKTVREMPGVKDVDIWIISSSRT